jgi:betaine-aldehyde dehydrogenase
MSHETRPFINGKYVSSAQGKKFSVFNPASGEEIASVDACTAEDIDIAVKAAKAALYSEGWGYKSTGAQRAVILRKLGGIIEARKDELAMLDSLDHGKPLREALADIGDAITACSHFADLAEKQDRDQNEVIENGTGGDFVTTISLEPIGVVGAITPWNYPFLMGIWKVIPAIAAGCCTVLKPSELAPLSCLVLAEMCLEAGLPAGALNVVPGLGHEAGAALVEHPDVDKVSFTGSVPTSRRIMAAAALGPRGISLELGGKSPLLVFEDADINATVDWIITGILWGSGQVCSATSRVLVHKSVRAPLLARLLERVEAIKMGDSLSADMMAHQGPTMGPVISKGQYDKIWTYIDDAKAQGLVFAYGGSRDLVAHLPKEGFFIPPTIIVDPPTTATVWVEEIFGPVLCIREFSSEDEAVAVANDSSYGLAAAVFSADAERCTRVGKSMRCGIVWKNCSQPAFVQAPWGGVKKSGFGRELGRWGLEEFTSVKQVTSCAHEFSWGLW